MAGCDKVPLKCVVDDEWVILRTGYICLWSAGVVARLSDCNTFRLSVYVRSSELQSGVHLSVFSSPRVFLVGTVLRAAASVL